MSDEYDKGYQRGLEVGRNDAAVFLRHENQRLHTERDAARREAEDMLETFIRQADDVATLRADRGEIHKQRTQAWNNTSVLFKEFVDISLLTPLGGEVDDYAAVTKAVRDMADEREYYLTTLKFTRNQLERLVSHIEQIEATDSRKGKTHEP